LAQQIDALAVRARAALSAASQKGGRGEASLRDDVALLADLETSVESADAAPTPDERSAWTELRARTLEVLASAGVPRR
jgi:hypothetical protein